MKAEGFSRAGRDGEFCCALARVFSKKRRDEVENQGDDDENAETESSSDEPDVGVVGWGCGGCWRRGDLREVATSMGLMTLGARSSS